MTVVSTEGINKRHANSIVPINYGFIKVIKAILHLALSDLELDNAAVILRSITIHQYRHLIINDELQSNSRLETAEEEFIISTEMSLTPASERLNINESICLPINFNDTRLGYLVVSLHNKQFPAADLTQRLERITLEIVNIIRRYQVRQRITNIYGSHPYWLGSSTALRQLDALIDQLAKSPKPILIKGDKGTGKIVAARALHCHDNADIRPFIESSCEEWEMNSAAKLLPELWAYAKGGTLLLRNIDKLSTTNVSALKNFWDDKKNQYSQQDNNTEVRLIMTTSVRQPENTGAKNYLSHWLPTIAQELLLPGLQERRSDIRDLTRFFIHDYRLNIPFDLDEQAWQLLDEFHWPGNVPQLKMMVQKLAVMIEQPLVTADILRALCPELESAPETGHFPAPGANQYGIKKSSRDMREGDNRGRSEPGKSDRLEGTTLAGKHVFSTPLSWPSLKLKLPGYKLLRVKSGNFFGLFV